MAIDKHDTPMLDQLEGGPWPSFISGIKRLRDEVPKERINAMNNDLLGQLETSYETRKGYWKGGLPSSQVCPDTPVSPCLSSDMAVALFLVLPN